MKKNRIIVVCCLVFMMGDLSAQIVKRTYASVSLHAGETSLGYNVKGLDGIAGTTSAKIGFGVSAKYNRYFDPHWGFGAGIGLSIYNSEALLHGGMDDTNTYMLGEYKDDDNSGLPRSFMLRARVENMKEKQQIYFFEIPVSLLYQSIFARGKWGVYGSIGLKLQTPIVNKLESVSNPDSRLNVSGLYTDNSQGFDVGAPGMPALPEHGFGAVDNPGKTLKWKNNNTALKFGVAGTLEAGIISRLDFGSDLLIGAYLDYGFSDIKKRNISLLSGPSPTVGYQPEANDNVGKGIIYNGLLNSNHTDIIKPLSFGLKVGVRFKI